jgi:hypothetical protein
MTRYRRTKNHWTTATPIGSSLPEKAEQLWRLEDYLVLHLAVPPLDVGLHPIYRKAKAHVYDCLDPFFAEVDAEVARRKAPQERRDGAAVDIEAVRRVIAAHETRLATKDRWDGRAPQGQEWSRCPKCRSSFLTDVRDEASYCPSCDDGRAHCYSDRARAFHAFAELGRIVGEHAGDPKLGQATLSNGITYETWHDGRTTWAKDKMAASGRVNFDVLQTLNKRDGTGLAAWSNNGKGCPSLRDATLKGYGEAIQKTRTTVLRDILREHTTLSLGECDTLAAAMVEEEAARPGDAPTGWGKAEGAAVAIDMGLGSAGPNVNAWFYCDRNGAERRIDIPKRAGGG